MRDRLRRPVGLKRLFPQEILALLPTGLGRANDRNRYCNCQAPLTYLARSSFVLKKRKDGNMNANGNAGSSNGRRLVAMLYYVKLAITITIA